MTNDILSASENPLNQAVAIAHSLNAKLYLVRLASSSGAAEASQHSHLMAWKDATQLERQLVLTGKLKGLHHQVIVREGL